MAKFCGMVGYGFDEETALDVHEYKTIERKYYGDVTRNSRRWEQGIDVNDDLNINNMIEIVADPYAFAHFFAIKYVEWMGTKWKVTNVEVRRPRLILTIGGVYNGPTPEP